MKYTIIVRRAARSGLMLATLTMGALLGGVGSTLADEPFKDKGWERRVALGVTVTSGNSDSVGFNGSIDGKRAWEHDEALLLLEGGYAKTEGTVSSAKIHGKAQYNHLFNERLYGLAAADALHDDVADVAYRVTLGPGVGYYFIKSDATKLSGEVGPSVVFEKLQHQNSDIYPALRLGEKFEHKLNEGARIFESVELTPQIDDFENFVAVVEVGVEAALTKTMSIRLVAQDTFDNQPAPGRKRNDFTLIGALAYKF